jgi:hypothetical protein
MQLHLEPLELLLAPVPLELDVSTAGGLVALLLRFSDNLNSDFRMLTGLQGFEPLFCSFCSFSFSFRAAFSAFLRAFADRTSDGDLSTPPFAFWMVDDKIMLTVVLYDGLELALELAAGSTLAGFVEVVTGSLATLSGFCFTN